MSRETLPVLETLLGDIGKKGFTDEGKLTIPVDPSIPLLGQVEPIQDVASFILKLQEAEKQEKKKREKRSLKAGEGQNLALSRGMFVGPMSKLTAFKSIYGFQ